MRTACWRYSFLFKEHCGTLCGIPGYLPLKGPKSHPLRATPPMFRPRLLARSSYTLLRPRSPSRPFERSRRAFSSPPSSSRNGIIFISGLLGLSYFAYNTLGNTLGNNTIGNDDAESMSNSFFKRQRVKDVQSVTKPLKRPPALIGT